MTIIEVKELWTLCKTNESDRKQRVPVTVVT